MFTEAGYTTVSTPKTADALVWTGGSDVNPELYGEHPIAECGAPNNDRDDHEKELFHKYYNKPSVGICRGAQFLNVMNKGKLWQHSTDHALAPPKGHVCFTRFTPQGVAVTSTHHQEMIANPDTGEIIGWAFESRLKKKKALTVYVKDRTIPANPITNTAGADTEIVWYDKSQSLCFQPHPEYGVESCRNLFFFLFDTYIK
jgi:hypothetical protein